MCTCEADRLLTVANGGVSPELTFTQLECLQVVLSQEDFARLLGAVLQEHTELWVADLGAAVLSPVEISHSGMKTTKLVVNKPL